jgi:DNA primase
VTAKNSNRARSRIRDIDVAALKQAHPIEAVIRRYGVDLRRVGRSLSGRCPFHDDQGRPNLYVWPETASWFCFRCALGGDVIHFVELAENLSFREAIDRLDGSAGPITATPRLPRKRASNPISTFDHRDPQELIALQAATALYNRRLVTDPDALAYVRSRGLDETAIIRCRMGYASGTELLAYMKWRRLPLAPAMRVGLLNSSGRETLARRVVVPEFRSGQPVWLVGRILPQEGGLPEDQEETPKYLVLPGPKPLLGLEQARDSPAVVVCEGIFDYLTAVSWGYPTVGLTGTHVSAEVVDQLRTFPRVYLVLDPDHAGVKATLSLCEALGASAIPVALQDGIRDVA